MAKDVKTKNLSIFADVMTALAADAVAEIDGISLLSSRRSTRGSVSVYFLPNDRVTLDLFVTVEQGYIVPAIVAIVQEKVKSEIEGATKFRVHSINVQVVSVNIQQ